LLETAESLKTKGQLKPIVVVALSPEESGDSETTHEIVDGERRWRSAQLGGISELDCIVKSRAEVQDWIKQHQASIELNNGSEELTPDETVQALLVQHKAGHTYEELGLMFNGKSAGWARGMLLVENLITPIRNRLDPELPRDEQITLGLAKLLAKAPQNRQEGIFNQVWLEKGSKLRNLKAKQLIAEFCDKRKHNNWPHQQRELVRKVPNVLGDVLSLGAVTDSGIESFVRGTAPKDVEAMRRQIAGSIEGLKALEERIADALDHVYKRT
jgi:ParB-like chromosome segregation protein Spo0J